MIPKEKIVETQNEWGARVAKIGALKNNRHKCKAFTNDFIDKLYAFESGAVLFKPTKTKALSYFIVEENRVCNKDKGFAIQPWTKVRFENAGIASTPLE